MTAVFVCLFCLKKVLCKRIPHEDSSSHVNRSLVSKLNCVNLSLCILFLVQWLRNTLEALSGSFYGFSHIFPLPSCSYTSMHTQ